jgi:hypothetical protein
MSEWARKTQQTPHFLYVFCEDILCGRYVTHEILCTVLRLSTFFEPAVMYSRALRHKVIPEIYYPDGGVS